MELKFFGINWARDKSVTIFLLLILLVLILKWWNPQDGCYAGGRFSGSHMQTPKAIFACGERQMAQGHFLRAEGWYQKAVARGYALGNLRLYEIHALSGNDEKFMFLQLYLKEEGIANIYEDIEYVEIQTLEKDLEGLVEMKNDKREIK